MASYWNEMCSKRKMEIWRKQTHLLATQLRAMEDEATRTKGFSTNYYHKYVGWAVTPITLLHPVCTSSTALHLGYVSIISPFGSGNRHLLNILLAQTSETLYFSIVLLLRAAFVHSVPRFFLTVISQGIDRVGWNGISKEELSGH